MSADQPDGTKPNAPQESSPSISDAREVYNIVSDTYTGVNFRKSDNVFQAIYTFAATLLLTVVGAIAA